MHITIVLISNVSYFKYQIMPTYPFSFNAIIN